MAQDGGDEHREVQHIVAALGPDDAHEGTPFASTEPLECGDLLADWLARGRHGFMDYLAREPARRLQPRSALAGAATVIVAAWPYRPPPQAALDWRSRLTGRIAAYALGTDYHTSLGAKLEDLAAFIDESCGARCRARQIKLSPKTFAFEGLNRGQNTGTIMI